uniref:Uncharacterized protein n=1 Tax=Rhizophora mucronata TaxID=61149 RepID=A0A2P2QCL9_RHIMU
MAYRSCIVQVLNSCKFQPRNSLLLLKFKQPNSMVRHHSLHIFSHAIDIWPAHMQPCRLQMQHQKLIIKILNSFRLFREQYKNSTSIQNTIIKYSCKH